MLVPTCDSKQVARIYFVKVKMRKPFHNFNERRERDRGKRIDILLHGCCPTFLCTLMKLYLAKMRKPPIPSPPTV